MGVFMGVGLCFKKKNLKTDRARAIPIWEKRQVEEQNPTYNLLIEINLQKKFGFIWEYFVVLRRTDVKGW